MMWCDIDFFICDITWTEVLKNAFVLIESLYYQALFNRSPSLHIKESNGLCSAKYYIYGSFFPHFKVFHHKLKVYEKSNQK